MSYYQLKFMMSRQCLIRAFKKMLKDRNVSNEMKVKSLNLDIGVFKGSFQAFTKFKQFRILNGLKAINDYLRVSNHYYKSVIFNE